MARDFDTISKTNRVTKVVMTAWSDPKIRRGIKLGTVSLVILSLFFSVIVNLMNPGSARAQAYSMQTGTYIGNAATQSITGLGFSPELVIVKPATTAGAGAIFKTATMLDNTTGYLSGAATADDTTGFIGLLDDGFKVYGTSYNAVNVVYTWMAFGGSDCSSTGNFCVSDYVGTGSGAQSVVTGFQPDFVVSKAATALAPAWRSSSMSDNYAQFFSTTNQDTTGAYFTTLNSNGFTVGASINTAVRYHYFAFKNVTGLVNVGSYTGTGVAKSITDVGFQPEAIIIKNANATTAVAAVYNVTQSYGNSTSYFSDTANLTTSVTSLDSGGFSVGVHSTANGSGNAIYWVAFGGAATPTSSGTFQMTTGTYTGNGSYQYINGLGFEPDLVIVKGNTTAGGVFRTSYHFGDNTSYLAAGSSDFTLGIQSFSSDGFLIGTSATVNSNGVAYYWTAYGNAWSETTKTGASDFAVGAYYGSSTDSRNITGLPFQPDLVVIKNTTSYQATFLTSSQPDDTSGRLDAAVEYGNGIQDLTSDGFQIGTATYTNNGTYTYRYFAFRAGTNFAVGTYSGTGSSQTISSVGFEADNLWIKSTAAVQGVERTSDMPTDSALPLTAYGSITGAVTALTSTGFTVDTASETNTSGTDNYRYIAWNKNVTVTTPTFEMQTGTYVGSGSSLSVSGLGFSPELVILKPSTTAGAGAIFKTAAMLDNATGYLSGAATADATTGLIRLKSDGFEVTGTSYSAVNVTYTWMAFTGSNCSSSGIFCVGNYVGTGSGTQAVTTGFQPNMVAVKAATALAPAWRSSSMSDNYAQFFAATNQDTTGAYFTTLNSNGFTVGAKINTAVTYHYFAFKSAANSIAVGTYTGTGAVKNVTDPGFKPNAVIIKSANATTPAGAVYNVTQSYGNSTSYFSDTANVAGAVTSLDSTGFSVYTSTTVNGSGNAIHWVAFGGAAAPTSSGTFQMSTGSYTGNGGYQYINGIGFEPDLVVIKGDTTSAGVYRTSMHFGDSSSYIDAATADVGLAIQSLNPDGFSVGTSASVNASGVTYYWTAYGNAWSEVTKSGSSDFVIGAYYGNGGSISGSIVVTNIPFQPDMVAVKSATALSGMFRTSSMSGDVTANFSAKSDATKGITSLNADGFTLGTLGNVNTAATMHYFGFVTGSNFVVGNYSGNGTGQTISSVGFSSDSLWIKSTAANQGVQRTSDMATDGAIPFVNVASLTGAVTALTSSGFTVGTAAETNTSGTNNYWYVAWRSTDTNLTVGQSGTQASSINIPSSNNYIGAAFTLAMGSGNLSTNLSSITISETGTVDANADISNVDLYYEQAASCSYGGTETLWDSAAFNSSQQATFSGDLTLEISTSQTCFYAVIDVGSGATGGETVELEVTNPSTDLVVSKGDVLPVTAVALSGTTTLASSGISISGTTDLSTGTVAVAVGSTLQTGKTGTISGGNWTISGVTAPATGAAVTVWVTGSPLSTAVTTYGGMDNIGGMVLNSHVLSVGNSDGRSLTISDLTAYDHEDDANIIQGNPMGGFIVDVANNFTDEAFNILSGNTFTVAGGEAFTTHDITINGTLVSSGTNTYTVNGSWTNSGVFTAGTSTVYLNSTGSETFSGTLSGSTGKFYDIHFKSSAGSWSFGSTATEVSNYFHLEAGTVTAPSSTLTVSGNFSNTGTFTANSGTVTFNATDSGNTLSGTMNSTSSFYQLAFNGIGGSWTIQDPLTTTATTTSSFVIGNGTVTLGDGANDNLEVDGTLSIANTANQIGTLQTYTSLAQADGTITIDINNNSTLPTCANCKITVGAASGTGQGTFTVNKNAVVRLNPGTASDTGIEVEATGYLNIQGSQDDTASLTGATETTMTAVNTWTTDAQIGRYIRMTSGLATGKTYLITDNDTHTLTRATTASADSTISSIIALNTSAQKVCSASTTLITADRAEVGRYLNDKTGTTGYLQIAYSNNNDSACSGNDSFTVIADPGSFSMLASSDTFAISDAILSTNNFEIIDYAHVTAENGTACDATVGGSYEAYIYGKADSETNIQYADICNLGRNTGTKYGIFASHVNGGSSNEGLDVLYSRIHNGYLGIRNEYSYYNNILGNEIYSNQAAGVTLDVFAQNNTVSANRVYSNTTHGIDVKTQARNNLIQSNYLYNNTQSGVYVYQGNNNRIIGNFSYGNTGFNIRIAYADYELVESNEAFGSGGDGIYIQLSNYEIINNNIVYCNAGDGISFGLSSAGNYVQGNTSFSNTTSGLSLQDNSSNTKFLGNESYGNAYGLSVSVSSMAVLGTEVVGDTYGVGGVNTTADIYFNSSSYDKTLICYNCTMGSTTEVAAITATSDYLISYNHDGTAGSTKVWGEYSIPTTDITETPQVETTNKFNQASNTWEKSALTHNYTGTGTEDTDLSYDLTSANLASGPYIYYAVTKTAGSGASCATTQAVFDVYRNGVDTGLDATSGTQFTDTSGGVNTKFTIDCGTFAYAVGDSYSFAVWDASNDTSTAKTITMMQDGDTFTAPSGTILELKGASALAATSITRAGSGTEGYHFVIGGTIDAQYYQFSYLGGTSGGIGLDLGSTATVTNLANGTFSNYQNVSTGDTYVRVHSDIIGTGAPTKTFSNITFTEVSDAVPEYTVTESGGTAPADGYYWLFNTAAVCTGWANCESSDSEQNTTDGGSIRWATVNIFRSVGPSATTALTSGASNAMSISGTTATFNSTIEGTNAIGVGDSILYDSDNNSSIDAIAFIGGRTDSTHFTVQSTSGTAPTATSTDDNDWAIYRAYTSFYNAERGVENTGISTFVGSTSGVLANFDDWTSGGDATTDDVGRDIGANSEVWNIACYANSTTSDTTAVVVAGWTTGLSNYIKIYTPNTTSEVGTSQRHSGSWSSGKYNLTIANSTGIDLQEENVRIDGLQIYVSARNNTHQPCVRSYNMTYSADVRFYLSNNIFRGDGSASYTFNDAFWSHTVSTSSGTMIMYASNNIGYDFKAGSSAMFSIWTSGFSYYLYNNTAYNCTAGFNSPTGYTHGAVILKNNIAYNNTDNYAGSFDSSSTNNLSGPGADAQLPTTNKRDGVTVTFADSGTGNFHLSSSDTGAQGYALNLYNDSVLPFQNDIDADDREGSGATWDIGADEIMVAANTAPNSPSSLAQKKTDDTVISQDGWTNETSVKLTVTASDTDNPDTLYLCVEVDLIGTAFSGTEDSCGSGVAYSGTGVTVTNTIASLTSNTQYHWQARIKDAAGAYSSWISYGTNGDPSDSDFGVDTAIPTGTVSINSGATYTNSTSVTLTVSGNDTGGSGLYQMRFSNDGSTWSEGWVTYSTSHAWTIALGDGTKTVYAQFKDNAGNVTASSTITLRAAGAYADGTTSVSVAQPAGTTTGDVLIAYILDKATSGTTDGPTGWTRVAAASGTNGRYQAYVAVVGQGGLGSSPWTFSGLTSTSMGEIIGYYNVDTTTPMDVTGSARYNTTGGGTAGITTVTNGARIVLSHVSLTNAFSWSAMAVANGPTLSEQYDNGNVNEIAIWDGTQTTAGDTGTASGTGAGGASSVGVLLSLRPVSGSSTDTIIFDGTGPTGLSVYDGDILGVQQLSSSSSLNSLSGNWTAANFDISGAVTPNKYQYAIGTTSGGTEILTWTSTNTDTTVITATSLTVNTGQMYYWTVKATDLAGNVTTVTSSGQQVEASLSFSVSTNTVTFNVLNNSNSYTDTKDISLTARTNAGGGYTVKTNILQLLTNIVTPSDNIANWTGTWTTPLAWAGNCIANSQCGFGYTSNDALVQGSNRFSSGSNYAAYSLSSPGDVVADNSGPTIDGSRNLVDEIYTLTNKVSTSADQTAGVYQTTLQVMITTTF